MSCPCQFPFSPWYLQGIVSRRERSYPRSRTRLFNSRSELLLGINSSFWTVQVIFNVWFVFIIVCHFSMCHFLVCQEATFPFSNLKCRKKNMHGPISRESCSSQLSNESIFFLIFLMMLIPMIKVNLICGMSPDIKVSPAVSSSFF